MAQKALTLIRQLNRLYDEEGRAFRVEQIAGGFHLMTRPAFADWLRRLAGTPAEVRLSVPAIETLAVVSYRQPVLRADIEAIRGVACGEILRQLMERDLVRIHGRSEELGRPFLYGTTTRFLHLFGLASLDELPRSEILRRLAPDDAAATSQQQQVEGDTAVVMTEGASVMLLEADVASGDARWVDPDSDAPAVDPTVTMDDDDDENSKTTSTTMMMTISMTTTKMRTMMRTMMRTTTSTTISTTTTTTMKSGKTKTKSLTMTTTSGKKSTTMKTRTKIGRTKMRTRTTTKKTSPNV